MLPIVTSVNPYTLQTPIVNTVTPGTAIAHAPYDNVAPSVSSAQVDNNARGNSAPPPAAEQPTADAVDTAFSEDATSGTVQSPSPGAQATFLAQLIGQDTSPETAGILVQYEKLAVFSNVKYKPSYAFKPPPEPSGVFGRILQTEKAAPAPQPQQVQLPPPVENTNASSASTVAAPQIAAPKSVKQSTAKDTAQPPADTAAPSPIGAYTASAGRVAALTQGTTAELV